LFRSFACLKNEQANFSSLRYAKSCPRNQEIILIAIWG